MTRINEFGEFVDTYDTPSRNYVGGNYGHASAGPRSGFVDSTDAINAVIALSDAGYAPSEISELSGVRTDGVLRIMHEGPNRVTQCISDALCALADERVEGWR